MYLKYSYYYFQSALSSDFCDKIINLGKDNVQEAEVMDKSKKQARNSSVAWLTDSWIYEAINPYIMEANKKAEWNFDLIGSEACQFTMYKEKQYYDWHRDSAGHQIENYIRKLSVTVSLEDGDAYEGGDLEFDLRDQEDSSANILSSKEARKKGSIIVFPSFVWHRVSPVTKGTRYSLVIWSHGPKYR